MAEGEEGNHVADMKAGPGGIAAYIERYRPPLHQAGKPLGVAALLKKPPEL
jgi:hypothetical protein